LEGSGRDIIEISASGAAERQDKPVRIINVPADIRTWHIDGVTARPACFVYIRRAKLSIIW
jgi:hypothetical protein